MFCGWLGCHKTKRSYFLGFVLIVTFVFSSETLQCISWLTAEQLCAMVLSTKVILKKKDRCVDFCDKPFQIKYIHKLFV